MKNRTTPSAKLRGLPRDSPDVRLSKTITYLLRHGAQKEGLPIRADGFVRVSDLIANLQQKNQSLNLEQLQEIVRVDGKQRFHLIAESAEGETTEEWLIKANQGHSLKDVRLELTPINSVGDIPTGIAVHGTTKMAWGSISTQGLSKMGRNHIHLAQGVFSDGVVSGMRKSSQILIFIDVEQAINAGIKFYLSTNGVVLTEGDENGFLHPRFFKKVENSKGVVLEGWEARLDSSI